MCGRYTLAKPAQELAQAFGVNEPDQLPLRFNIAPTQAVLVVRQLEGGRSLDWLRWGLIPSWSKDPKSGPLLINARADTVAEKPAYRHAFKSQRCLLPADGFFEWLKQGKQKQPVYFRMRDDSVFAFAGLWESWHAPDGSLVESCALITTEPNAVVAPVHDRMPAILPREAYDLWLDPSVKDAARLQPLLAPYPAQAMLSYPVTPAVNSVANDEAACIEPLGTKGQLPLPGLS